jgi:hypothetical protein
MRKVVLLVLALAAPASATPVLDLELLPAAGFFNTDNDTAVRQTIAVGTSGFLTRIDLFAVDDRETCSLGGCQLTLHDGAQLLGQAAGDATARVESDWISFALDVPVAVLAGQTLSFALAHDNVMILGASSYGGILAWECAIDGCLDPFDPLGPSGRTLPEVPEGTFFADLGVDFAMRVWIEPIATPEPSLALLAPLCVLAAWIRRRAGGVDGARTRAVAEPGPAKSST